MLHMSKSVLPKENFTSFQSWAKYFVSHSFKQGFIFTTFWYLLINLIPTILTSSQRPFSTPFTNLAFFFTHEDRKIFRAFRFFIYYIRKSWNKWCCLHVVWFPLFSNALKGKRESNSIKRENISSETNLPILQVGN